MHFKDKTVKTHTRNKSNNTSKNSVANLKLEPTKNPKRVNDWSNSSRNFMVHEGQYSHEVYNILASYLPHAASIYVCLYNSKGSADFSKAKPFMEAEVVLNLFDSCWFGHQNLKEHPIHENPDHQIKEESSKPMLSSIKTSHTRSMSDDQLNSTASFKHAFLSPDSVLSSPKLQTILSGKDVIDFTEDGKQEQAQAQLQVLLAKKNTTRNGRRKKGSKSLSDLEFEEVKGFMDLGFVFSEEDKDSSLASIIPGLQRLGKNGEEEENSDEPSIQRPYLSEAWEVQERRKKENQVMSWKIPAPTSENDMKYSLKCWAHTVASTVR